MTRTPEEVFQHHAEALRPSFVYQYVKVPLVTAEQVHKVGLLYARSAMDARR
jgi:hypothetical protein